MDFAVAESRSGAMMALNPPAVQEIQAEDEAAGRKRTRSRRKSLKALTLSFPHAFVAGPFRFYTACNLSTRCGQDAQGLDLRRCFWCVEECMPV